MATRGRRRAAAVQPRTCALPFTERRDTGGWRAAAVTQSRRVAATQWGPRRSGLRDLSTPTSRKTSSRCRRKQIHMQSGAQAPGSWVTWTMGARPLGQPLLKFCCYGSWDRLGLLESEKGSKCPPHDHQLCPAEPASHCPVQAWLQHQRERRSTPGHSAWGLPRGVW